MAVILDFRATSARAPSAQRRAGAGSAEIVIFPGIRYEYHDEPRPAEAAKPGRTARKRDRLEIVD